MNRFEIDAKYVLGIPVPELRKIGKAIKIDHDSTLELWKIKKHTKQGTSIYDIQSGIVYGRNRQPMDERL